MSATDGGAALLALAERVEKASGPDRILDAEVQMALARPIAECAFDADRLHHQLASIPLYTSSLDAALTLVPEGEQVGVEYYPWSHHAAKACAWGGNRHPIKTQRIAAVTPALAACAVALTLRANLSDPDVARAYAERTATLAAARGATP